MELSRQKMELFVPFSVIVSKILFNKRFLIWSNYSKMVFRNRTLNYLNRKWNCFSPFMFMLYSGHKKMSNLIHFLVLIIVLIDNTWEIRGTSHSSRLLFFCPIEGVLVGLNYLIRLWLSQSNTMYQRTYFLITSSELVELSLAQFDYIHCVGNGASPQSGFEPWSLMLCKYATRVLTTQPNWTIENICQILSIWGRKEKRICGKVCKQYKKIYSIMCIYRSFSLRKLSQPNST